MPGNTSGIYVTLSIGLSVPIRLKYGSVLRLDAYFSVGAAPQSRCQVAKQVAGMGSTTGLARSIQEFSAFYCFLYNRLSTIHVDPVHGVGLGIGPVRRARISDP